MCVQRYSLIMLYYIAISYNLYFLFYLIFYSNLVPEESESQNEQTPLIFQKSTPTPLIFQKPTPTPTPPDFKMFLLRLPSPGKDCKHKGKRCDHR